MFLQLAGTAIRATFGSLYACLSFDCSWPTIFAMGYLKETLLFPRLLPLNFTLAECKLNEEIFRRFTDDGFVLWSKNANTDVFRKFLN